MFFYHTGYSKGWIGQATYWESEEEGCGNDPLLDQYCDCGPLLGAGAMGLFGKGSCC
jgi:hypothetical protein